jgi:hypothetical protein
MKVSIPINVLCKLNPGESDIKEESELDPSGTIIRRINIKNFHDKQDVTFYQIINEEKNRFELLLSKNPQNEHWFANATGVPGEVVTLILD